MGLPLFERYFWLGGKDPDNKRSLLTLLGPYLNGYIPAGLKAIWTKEYVGVLECDLAGSIHTDTVHIDGG